MTTEELIAYYTAQGEYYDELSDAAFKAGRIQSGTEYGNAAIAAYSWAERLSIEAADDIAPPTNADIVEAMHDKDRL